jgi:hypothetical protein
MLRQYLEIWEWELIFGRAVKGVRSLCLGPWVHPQNLSRKRAKSEPRFKDLELNRAATDFHTFFQPCAVIG